MTHEFKQIIDEGLNALTNGLKAVIASVVALDGSSYRRPGVRMLIKSDGQMVGAVSGGCVEKEILLQSESVFQTGVSKVMTYDGRYRLGCEGVLYILIEPFNPDSEFLKTFQSVLDGRINFEIYSYFEKKPEQNKKFGSFLRYNDKLLPLNQFISKEIVGNTNVFKQKMTPCFKLIIIGAEHDAVQLCKYASLTGWEVSIIAGIKEAKSIDDFPGAQKLIVTTPESFDISKIDNETAVVLMTHNFAYDLRFLVALKDTDPNYIGLLGPTKRRDDLLLQLIEYCPNISEKFLETIHGPAGLNIGSETPQEIAISIISEILAFTRKRNPISLSQKIGRIHSN